jgi:hypothetical protein
VAWSALRAAPERLSKQQENRRAAVILLDPPRVSN